MNLKKLLIANSLLLLSISSVYADTLSGSKLDNLEIAQYRGVNQPTVSPTNQARVYYNTTLDTLMLSVNGGAYYPFTTNITAPQYFQNTPPATPNAPGVRGYYSFDNEYLYGCNGTGDWKRVAWDSWSIIRTLVNWQGIQVQWQGADVQI